MAIDAKALVLMEKEDGVLKNELGSYEIETGLTFVSKAYVENETIYLFVSTDRDIEGDDEFNEIYDNYNPDGLISQGCEVEEVEDEYNPTWLLKLPYEQEHTKMEAVLNDILRAHEIEIKRIYQILQK